MVANLRASGSKSRGGSSSSSGGARFVLLGVVWALSELQFLLFVFCALMNLNTLTGAPLSSSGISMVVCACV